MKIYNDLTWLVLVMRSNYLVGSLSKNQNIKGSNKILFHIYYIALNEFKQRNPYGPFSMPYSSWDEGWPLLLLWVNLFEMSYRIKRHHPKSLPCIKYIYNFLSIWAPLSKLVINSFCVIFQVKLLLWNLKRVAVFWTRPRPIFVI